MNNQRLRIYLTGVGGQGTLTATTLLSRIALDHGLEVTSGEIHGMAQRGGVVESTVLLGGWESPNIFHGEGDVLLGFEPLETLRGLAYLRAGGTVFSSSEFIAPPGVSAGRESLPSFDKIRDEVLAAAGGAKFLPIRSIGLQCGSVQSGNSALLGALCGSKILPFGLDVLKEGLARYLPAKIVDVNIASAEKGAAWA